MLYVCSIINHCAVSVALRFVLSARASRFGFNLKWSKDLYISDNFLFVMCKLIVLDMVGSGVNPGKNQGVSPFFLLFPFPSLPPTPSLSPFPLLFWGCPDTVDTNGLTPMMVGQDTGRPLYASNVRIEGSVYITEGALVPYAYTVISPAVGLQLNSLREHVVGNTVQRIYK